MAASFFFYDLETSGFDARNARIMQFAGQRTDADLQPIGDPVNVLIKLTPDILPEPDAILITGITPQQTISEGLTEAEFLDYFYEVVVKPDTTFIGYNSIRFDDEFMRFLHYRNFYDAYEWQWMDQCSRWDLLDVVRMTRALRPDGIEWPFASDGKPSNRLEMLASINKLEHDHAHDALSDVMATIGVAQLIRNKQPDLFEYLNAHRSKKAVAELVQKSTSFIYTSGRYPGQSLHTTAAVLLASHSQQDAALVYDLRHDPTPFLNMSVEQLIDAWQYSKDPDKLRLPVKTIKYNRCPTVAPLGVIKDKDTQERLSLELDTISSNLQLLKANQAEFVDKLQQAVARMDAERQQTQTALVDNRLSVDERLYDSFINKTDKDLMRVVRAAKPAELSELSLDFEDDRLRTLLPLYKARNYPRLLSGEERAEWDSFVAAKLLTGDKNSRVAKYFARLSELAADEKLSDTQRYLLEELQLYGESIIPSELA